MTDDIVTGDVRIFPPTIDEDDATALLATCMTIELVPWVMLKLMNARETKKNIGRSGSIRIMLHFFMFQEVYGTTSGK